MDTVVHTACGRCRKPLMKTALAPPSSLAPDSLSSSISSITAFSQQRSSSLTRQGEGLKRPSGQHSRHASVVSATGTDQGPSLAPTTALVEGGYGFCSNCRRASAKCSIWCVFYGCMLFVRPPTKTLSQIGLAACRSAVSISSAQCVLTEVIMNAIGTTTSRDH